jgi:hypothetical protein
MVNPKIVSANGSYYGASGYLSALSGPRGIGWWGSWWSLIVSASK